MVQSLEHDGSCYRLRLETGAHCVARAVVVAAGISHFATLPKSLSGLPQGLVTHTSEHNDLGVFKGRKVAVIGAGASAADVAGLLHEAGAEVHLIARGSLIPFHNKMRLPRPLYDRLRHPSTQDRPRMAVSSLHQVAAIVSSSSGGDALAHRPHLSWTGARVFYARPGYW